MGDPWPRRRSWIADAAAAVAKAAAAGGARREAEEEDEAPGRRPVRRQRGRHGRRGLPVLVVACLALLLVALALLGGAAEAKRAPPADSISVQIRKPRGSGGNGNGSGNGKKGPAAQGGNGEAGVDDVGPVAAAGDGAGGAAAGGRSMGMGGGETAAPDFLGRLTSSLAWKPSAMAPARRFGWRKLHITKDYLILESRLGADVFAIPRGDSGSGGIKVEKHPKATFLPSALPNYQPQARRGGGKSPAATASPTTTAGGSNGGGAASSLSIDGVFGFFDLPSGGHYLAVITDSEERYRGHGMEFRLITKVTLVRVSNSTVAEGTGGGEGQGRRGGRISTADMLGDEDAGGGEFGGGEGEEEDEDAKQLELLRMAFRAHDLYFSATCDVTLSAQRRATLDSTHHPSAAGDPHRFATPRPRLTPLWQRADERFFWNKNLLGPLIEAGAHDWVLPVMSAHVQAARNISLSGKGGKEEGSGSVGTLLLVSRRSCWRQGRRFVKRGIDAEGHTANFVETEQVFIAQKDGALTSLVQIRGSIPLFWASPANLKYTPKVQIQRTLLENTVAMGRHYHDLLSRYHAPVVLVNLIDRKKDQGRLGRAFDTVHHLVTAALRTLPPAATKPGAPFLAEGDHSGKHSSLSLTKKKKGEKDPAPEPPGVRLTWFDFHAECKHMRWDRLSLLLDALQDEIAAQGFFHADGQGRIRRLQRGVLRTNCMDCLDRTNVVQSIFARASLARQLGEVLALPPGAVEGGTVLQLPFDGVERPFRHLWSGNADAISLLYAGTPALKGDFTRTGKRTRRGALQDGIHSVKRYVINNFVDAWNQRAVEAMLGRGLGADPPFTVLPEHDTGLTPGQLAAWRRALREGAGVAEEGVAVDVEGGDLDRLLGEVVPEVKGKGLEVEEEDDEDEEDGDGGEEGAVMEVYEDGAGFGDAEGDGWEEEGDWEGDDDEDEDEDGGEEDDEAFRNAAANAAQGFM